MSEVRIKVKPKLLTVKIVALRGLPSAPTDEQIHTAVNDYFEGNPPATIPDSTYPLVTAGDALHIAGSKQTDNSPYLFRKSHDGYKVEYELDGYSVAWNQLQTATDTTETVSGVTYTNNGDGTWTVSGTATAQARKTLTNSQSVTGHVVLITGSPSGGSTTTYCLLDNLQSDGNKYDSGNGRIYRVTNSNGRVGVKIQIGNGYTASNIVFRPQVFDLTRMFGSTIADYVYTLEQATAGSGIAYLQSHGLFTKSYYPYDAGSIQSVKTSGRKIVGFNQWDEDMELGTFSSSTGEKQSSNNYVRSKNYIPVLPNTAYFFKAPYSISGSSIYIYYYDGNKEFLEGGRKWSSSQTTPQGARYMMFACAVSAYGASTYNNNICINISDPQKNGTYEPYTTTTYPLFNIELRGKLELDSNNRLRANGDVQKSDGSVARRYGVVDLGTLTWSRSAITTGSSVYMFYNNFPSAKRTADNATVANIVCAIYTPSARNDLSTNNKAISVNSTGFLSIRDDSYTDAATFKTAMSGVYAVYELATPTTETTDPYDALQLVYDGGAEEFIDTRDVPIPVGNTSAYTQDAFNGEIPKPPTTNGTYTLKVTVSGGVPTFSWISG